MLEWLTWGAVALLWHPGRDDRAHPHLQHGWSCNKGCIAHSPLPLFAALRLEPARLMAGSALRLHPWALYVELGCLDDSRPSLFCLLDNLPVPLVSAVQSSLPPLLMKDELSTRDCMIRHRAATEGLALGETSAKVGTTTTTGRQSRDPFLSETSVTEPMPKAMGHCHAQLE